MTIFVDTSSLYKLYHRENDTELIERVFTGNTISSLYLSEITKIEFYSTSWKKVRQKEITESDARTIINTFEKDLGKYNFIKIGDEIAAQAKNLIEKYGRQGLRTLDSIQLSTAISLMNQCQLYVTSDKLMHSFFKLESLPVY
jgi:predicted nucleic acid-binding protein